VSPDDAEEERSGRGHDGDVWQRPAAVVVGQGVDRLQEEGVAGNGAHSVVGDTGRDGFADPRWISEKGVKAAIASLCCVSAARSDGVYSTYIIQVNVDSAKVVQHKVSNGIGALDGVRIAVKGLEKPWVFGTDELPRLLVGPELYAVSLGAYCLSSV
jgi:hypothetical protein